MKYLLPLLIDMTAFLVAIILTPLLVICYFRGPLESHRPHMQTEYPDLMAFVRTEEKIDLFLLYLENR